MKTIKRFLTIPYLITLLSFFLCLFLLVANTLVIFKFKLFELLLPIIIIVSLFIIYRKKILNFINKKSKLLFIISIILIVLSIVLRFTFLSLNYIPLSDPSSFFYNALYIANSNVLENPNYVAFYPFLFGYAYILGLFMKVFGTTIFSIILLNTLIDIIGTFLLYLLIKNLTKNKKVAYITSFIYIMNPINFFFSVISLPVIAVNTSIILVLYFLQLLYSNISCKSMALLFSIIVALSLSLLNAFRPFAVIFIIAITIYSILNMFNAKKYILNYIISFFIIISIYFIANTVMQAYITKYTGLTIADNPSGWSIYNGSNYSSSGTYSDKDATYLGKLSEQNSDVNVIHSKLRHEGIERYKSNGLKNVVLFAKKGVVLGGAQHTTVYNLSSYDGFYQGTRKKAIEVICGTYSFILILISFYSFYNILKTKDKSLHFITYLQLVFLGLFASGLLVEVSSRYFTPFYVFLVVFCSYTLLSKKNKKLK